MIQNLTITREVQTSLDLGEYTIIAQQQVEVQGTKETFETRRVFLVAGPRFVLEPNQVIQVFPPPYTNGDYNNFLPYITLSRTTLPWERQVDTYLDVPFLALLVLSEQDLASGVRVKNVKIGDFVAGRSRMALEASDDATAFISVIEAGGLVLQELLPRRDDLTFLAHVRQRGTAAQEAVILSNRRPLPNTRYVVHLVSLEGLNPNMLTEEAVQVPSLYRWEFTCGTDKTGLVDRLRELHCDGLRLPERAGGSVAFQALRGDGYAAMPYRFAWGDRTHALYRGPLLPVAVKESLESTYARVKGLSSGEGLVDYLQDLGLVDVSLAAAWELGRMLMLRNRDVAMSYFRFRRAESHLAEQLDNVDEEQHLAYDDVPPTLAELPPDDVVTFCKGLLDFQGIPFGYLVPEPRMLPEKSLRVFQVDTRWLVCLLAGALSPGRARTVDREREIVYLRGLVKDVVERSGVLLRSPVVAERPNQTYVFKASADTPVPILLRNRLASDVTLFLVQGVFNIFEASEEPKAAQFGFKEILAGDKKVFSKDLRDPTNFKELPDGSIEVLDAHYRDAARGVFDVLALAQAFTTKKAVVKSESHHFALQLIESGAGAMSIRLGGTSP